MGVEVKTVTTPMPISGRGGNSWYIHQDRTASEHVFFWLEIKTDN
jgi:hypothetical protein